PAPDWPYGPTPPADATAPAPAATPPRRGPGWGGVGALVVLGMVLSSGATLGGVVAYDQLLDAEPQVSAQPAPEPSSEARPAAAVTREAPNWATVAETVSPSTVAIQVATGGGTSHGTGVVLDEAGSIFTNNHVIADVRQIRVPTRGGLCYSDSVICTDSFHALTVLLLDTPP